MSYHGNPGPIAGPFFILFMFAALVAAWGTHIFWTIKTLASPAGATVGQAALGIIGAIMPPVGVLHGIAIWLGLA